MNRVAALGTFAFMVLVLCGQSWALQIQDVGGFDPTTIDPSIFGNGGTGTNNVGNANTVSGNENVGGEVGDFAPPIPEISDDRFINGFIGRTKANIEEQGFVGPTQGNLEQVSGSGTTGGATSGRTTGGQTGGFGGFGGFGGAGATNGFSITRSNVRARVRPNFSYRSIPTEVTATNFQNRIQRLPNLREASPQNISVKIEGTTATLNGSAPNQEAIDNLVGQLRMEPGVYRIVNQVQITSAVAVGK